MERKTELETKVVEIIKKNLATVFEKEQSLKESLSNISITPYDFTEDLPKVLVVTMPLNLLIYVKLESNKITSEIKKNLQKYMIVFRRSGDIPCSKISNPMKAREEILADLVFPAVVSGRSNEVESRDEKTQVVYLDGKNPFWAKHELSALEKLLCNVFGQNFKVRLFGHGF